MLKPRYLTKSRFKLALECPTKLFYTRKSQRYTDTSIEDTFMLALAEGGFQVGELAKYYKWGGKDITTLNEEEALALTEEEMKKENAIIYEGAFLFGKCFIRADVVVKKGKNIHLYEVKAKSYRGNDGSGMIGKRSGSLKSEWKPYVFDVAFQKYVLQNIFSEYRVYAYLTLADKDVICDVDGLNQLFLIEETNGRKSVKVSSELDVESLGTPLLTDVNVDDILDQIYSEDHEIENGSRYAGRTVKFLELVKLFEDHYHEDEEIDCVVSKACLDCQFRDESNYEKSGFHRCWQRTLNFTKEDFERTSSFELWGGGLGARSLKSEFIQNRKFFMKDIEGDDVAPKKIKDVPMGMSKHERRLYQIGFTKSNSNEPIVILDDLKLEMESWTYPLHFIDFETTALAIPMHKGMSPYEGIAFQFSHHQVEEDGMVSHKGEWINFKKGTFPSFEFVRQLKSQLDMDEGTIFRYHNHENTYLNMIYKQLKTSEEKDKKELMEFIKTITKPTSDNADQWEPGTRNMVDLYQLVLSYYLHPFMKGSNSIKQVLPAVLNDSEFLQKKYSQPIYGGDIPSKNFTNKVWVEYSEEGIVKDPYKLLDSVFDNLTNDQLDSLVTAKNNELSDGGAAMMAYAKMQFTEMSDLEREKYKEALLKYCELDTLAMVMIYEHWMSVIG